MVEVTGAGVVVGEYLVRPFLIGAAEYRVLERHWYYLRELKAARVEEAV